MAAEGARGGDGGAEAVVKGGIYWIAHPSRVWSRVVVEAVRGNGGDGMEGGPGAGAGGGGGPDAAEQVIQVRVLDDGSTLDLQGDCLCLPVNPITGVSDLTTLHHMHEAAILQNLEERSDLRRGDAGVRPYTYIANVVVAVNPLRPVPDPGFDEYRNMSGGSPVEPHPYWTGEFAYRRLTMAARKQRTATPAAEADGSPAAGATVNQAIIISGESGSGKTETAKMILRYLCTRARSVAGLDRKLLQSNPILEAFGNACTLRNDNSSRFGKYMKLQFSRPEDDDGEGSSSSGEESKQSGAAAKAQTRTSAWSPQLLSASLDTYLLEKSRIVHVGDGERNFHVFYQLLRGANAKQKKKWKLLDPERYTYLNSTDTLQIENIDDAQKFRALVRALESIHVGEAEQDVLFRTISAVLHLGNLVFADQDGEGGAEAAVTEQPQLLKCAALLGVDPDYLGKILCTRKISVSRMAKESSVVKRDSVYRVARDATQASFVRHSVAKSLYAQVFNWLVHRIAKSWNAGPSELPTIGVLDIFGFERFETNSLEQLLINYANEALQGLYCKAVLADEQQLYLEEGLLVASVDYDDNAPCVELLAGPNGILELLHSTGRGPKPSDEVFNQTIVKQHRKHDFFPLPHPRDRHFCFQIEHYSGIVQYTVHSFISKNMDLVPEELPELVIASTLNDRSDLFCFTNPEIAEHMASKQTSAAADGAAATARTTAGTDAATDRDGAAAANTSGGSGRGGGGGAPGRKKRTRTSVAVTFKRQMEQLHSLLTGSQNLFIRCIKPNATMAVGEFDRQYVVDQLRCLGVVETCEVLKAGMPTRIPIAELRSMFDAGVPEALRSRMDALSPADTARALLWAFEIPPSAVQLGRTRIFFRTGQMAMLQTILSAEQGMDEEKRQWLTGRLTRWFVRRAWRRALVKVIATRAFLTMLTMKRTVRAAATRLQIFWRVILHSAWYQRRKVVRRRWRITILAVQCQRVFLEDYLLIKEATAMRLKAEREAEEEEERHKKIEEAKRAAAAGAGGVLEPGVDAKTSGEEAPAAAGAPVSSSSLQTAEQMQIEAAAAASLLATVSVCLRRWINLRLFRAMDKWVEVADMARKRDLRMGAGGMAEELGMQQTMVGPEDTADILSMEHKSSSPGGGALHDAEGTGDMEDDLGALLGEPGESAFLCFECDAVTAAMWCMQCQEPYCTVCCASVHNSCKTMRKHEPGPLALRDKMEEQAKQERLAEIEKRIRLGEAQDEAISSVGTEISAMEHRRTASEKMEQRPAASREAMRDLDRRASKSTAAIRRERDRHRRGQTGGRSHSRARSQLPTTSELDEFRDTMDVPRDSHATGGRYRSVSISESMRSKDELCSIRGCSTKATKGVSIRFCDLHYAMFREHVKSGGDSAKSRAASIAEGATESKTGGVAAPPNGGGGAATEEHKTLQQQVALLKRQLAAVGQQPVEFVELSVARTKMQEAVQRLLQGDETAEAEVEKWDQAIRMNPDYAAEQEKKRKEWEASHRQANMDALRMMRGLVPPHIATCNMADIAGVVGMPPKLAQRLWSKKTLWLLRMHPDDIKKTHIADLHSKYGNQGLDIVEMRAIWCVLPEDFENDGDGKKGEWRLMFRQKLEELTTKSERNSLSRAETRNPAYDGCEHLRLFDPNAPLQRAGAVKSTAFAPTEQAVVGPAAKEAREKFQQKDGGAAASRSNVRPNFTIAKKAPSPPPPPMPAPGGPLAVGQRPPPPMGGGGGAGDDPRAGLMDAIRRRREAAERGSSGGGAAGAGDGGGVAGGSGGGNDPRAGLLSAIRRRREGEASTRPSPIQEAPGNSERGNRPSPGSAMMGGSAGGGGGGGGGAQAELLAALRRRQQA